MKKKSNKINFFLGTREVFCILIELIDGNKILVVIRIIKTISWGNSRGERFLSISEEKIALNFAREKNNRLLLDSGNNIHIHTTPNFSET